MDMQKKCVIVLSAVLIVLNAFVCFPIISTSDEGTWPDTWPQELEKYRKQSKTYNLSSGTEEEWHEILFEKREEFEKAWPHILTLKTKGAPLIIETIQTGHGVLDPILQGGKPGVRILCPSRSPRGFSEETRNRLTPWPDYLTLPSGGMPEYVVYQADKWIPADVNKKKASRAGIHYRARIDIVLIIDSKIVDLNRIPLPADTPIIDKRLSAR